MRNHGRSGELAKPGEAGEARRATGPLVMKRIVDDAISAGNPGLLGRLSLLLERLPQGLNTRVVRAAVESHTCTPGCQLLHCEVDCLTTS